MCNFCSNSLTKEKIFWVKKTRSNSKRPDLVLAKVSHFMFWPETVKCKLQSSKRALKIAFGKFAVKLDCLI